MPRDIEKHKIAKHNHYLKNKDLYKKRTKKWKKTHREKCREYGRKYRKQKREEVIFLLGGKCVYCNCQEYDALEINHINGGGNKEKHYKISREAYYLDIISGRRPHNDLELTCRVCNAVHYLEKIKKLGGKWKVVYTPPNNKEGNKCQDEMELVQVVKVQELDVDVDPVNKKTN